MAAAWGGIGMRVVCDRCGEEISNGREVLRNGLELCRTCAGDGYYLALENVSDPKQANISWHSKQDRLSSLVG
jgi:hypothetical protein